MLKVEKEPDRLIISFYSSFLNGEEVFFLTVDGERPFFNIDVVFFLYLKTFFEFSEQDIFLTYIVVGLSK